MNTYVVVAELVLPSSVADTSPDVEYIDSYQVEASHPNHAITKVAEANPQLSFANVRLSVES